MIHIEKTLLQPFHKVSDSSITTSKTFSDLPKSSPVEPMLAKNRNLHLSPKGSGFRLRNSAGSNRQGEKWDGA